ncbi:hypothetical protein LTR37_017564 [Vermiconidia calcicola]|uniref:Uncharacterized protein n=1 Tax=Vermiconidia calcicola TaxID=1690605 RepID=A0ACC3ML50_9PEZI|nr:hypothetical protein LTR37_017564 [Vermiconidia calcicola]
MKLDTAPAIDVTVRVNGADLQEHDDTEHNEEYLKGVKYVECVPETDFAVHLHVRKSQLGGYNKDQIRCDVYLDGEFAIARLPNPYSTPAASSEWDFGAVESTINGRCIKQNFAFARLRTDDGPSKDLKPIDFKQQGEIKVKCTLVRTRKLSKMVTHDVASFKRAGDEVLPEKCLKGRSISNQVALGKAQPLATLPVFVHVDYPYGKQPFATYVFKYRSRRDLQIEGIIPRSPSPVPLEDRAPEDLSPEEARELVRRLRKRDSGRAKIKDENLRIKKEKRNHATLIEDDDENDVTITEEIRGRKRTRNSRDSAIEIIDLSGD